MKALPALPCALLLAVAHAAPPVPACQNERQCDAMWAAAQVALSTATGMPNRLVSDDRIETFPATTAHQLTGVVTKQPSGAEGYKFVVDLSCHGAAPCDDLARAGTELFNTLVSNAGAGLGPQTPPKPLERSAALGR